MTAALEGGEWSAARPGRRSHFTPGKDLVPIVQEAEWATGPVWRAENLVPIGIFVNYNFIDPSVHKCNGCMEDILVCIVNGLLSLCSNCIVRLLL